MLLVKRDPPELRCGEILIPGTANLGVTTSGTVVRVGPRAEGVFKPGERVIFGILAGLSLASEGVSSEEEYRLVAAGDIQCWIAHKTPRPGSMLVWVNGEVVEAQRDATA
jgi:NADPH:quinone reductase-like Zn-dependent oxidoreductase